MKGRPGVAPRAGAGPAASARRECTAVLSDRGPVHPPPGPSTPAEILAQGRVFPGRERCKPRRRAGVGRPGVTRFFGAHGRGQGGSCHAAEDHAGTGEGHPGFGCASVCCRTHACACLRTRTRARTRAQTGMGVGDLTRWAWHRLAGTCTPIVRVPCTRPPRRSTTCRSATLASGARPSGRTSWIRTPPTGTRAGRRCGCGGGPAGRHGAVPRPRPRGDLTQLERGSLNSTPGLLAVFLCRTTSCGGGTTRRQRGLGMRSPRRKQREPSASSGARPARHGRRSRPGGVRPSSPGPALAGLVCLAPTAKPEPAAVARRRHTDACPHPDRGMANSVLSGKTSPTRADLRCVSQTRHAACAKQCTGAHRSGGMAQGSIPGVIPAFTERASVRGRGAWEGGKERRPRRGPASPALRRVGRHPGPCAPRQQCGRACGDVGSRAGAGNGAALPGLRPQIPCSFR